MADEIYLSKAFILEEVPLAPPLYLSIYLMTQALPNVDAATVARKLNVLESDVVRAWQYFEQKKATPKPAPSQPRPNLGLAIAKKPEYTMEELQEYMKREDMKQLLMAVQKKLGKPLTQQDIAMVFGFYDWLGLPMDVIEMLFSYCVSDGFKGMRYVEKVAMAWADEGIYTVEQAGEHIEMRKTGYGAIMRAFGQGGRMPVEGEEVYMRKWLTSYGMTLAVIKLACERTIMQTGKVSFPYADGILSKWKEAGVKSIEDVETLDQVYTAKKAINASSQKAQPKEAPKQKQNKFINYTQRQWDFEKLEALQREEQKKW